MLQWLSLGSANTVMDSDTTLFRPMMCLLLVVAAAIEVHGCVCYVGQEPNQATGKPYGWSLAEHRPCECTEFRLGGVNMRPHLKPFAWEDSLRQFPGSMKHVSIGEAGVWGVDDRNRIYKRSCGCSWTLISGELKQIDVGMNVVWGTNYDDNIFYREVSVSNPDIHPWILVEGYLKHVTVSQKGHVWGVNRYDHVYHRENANINHIAGSQWKYLPLGLLKQISVGSGGVWGISPLNSIHYRVGTYGDPESDPDGSDWQWVQFWEISLMKYVSSGDVIFAVGASDSIYYRVGTSAENPIGTAWQQIDENLKQIESISNTFWGVDSANNVHTNESESCSLA